MKYNNTEGMALEDAEAHLPLPAFVLWYCC